MGKVTRGQGVVLGRDVVAPLPDPVQGVSWHVSTLARGWYDSYDVGVD